MIALLLLTTSHQPGDTVVIVSRREGVERRATTVLGKRST
jgi:hypothetical protein